MRIGSLWVSVYTLWLWAGVVLAIGWLAWAAPRYGILYRQWSRWGVVAVLAAVLVGRTGFVLLHWEYFAQNPSMVWRVGRAPGIHGAGAAAGAIAALLLLARRLHVGIAELFALSGPACLAVAIGVWLGCLQVGCAWGREIQRSTLPTWAQWSVARLPDLYRIEADRYAVQAIGAGWALLWMALGMGVKPMRPWVFPIYLMGQAVLALLRGDPVTAVRGVRADLFTDLAMAGGWAAAVAPWPRRSTERPLS